MKGLCIDLVQDLLLCKSNHVECMKRANKLFNNKCYNSKYSCIKRLCRSYYDYCTKGIGLEDFLANLRQVILTLKMEFSIDEYFIGIVEKDCIKFGLEIHNFGKYCEINASKFLPKWMGNVDDFYKVYDYEKNYSKKIVYGDSKLYYMTGYETYTSNCQKLLMRTIINQQNGTTILGCMPTGSGKSLLMHMPSFYDDVGTTIVVVPTVSLAMDQAISSSKYFKDRDVAPEAYYSKISTIKKQQIFKLLRRGQLPLLFISPEALLNSSFNEIVVEIAKKGFINRLVIDEAHIVADWGEFFRTDFQFLAIFRRKLIEATQNGLKTILLSATLSDRVSEILKLLFSENDNFIEVRGDELRKEIIYYTVKNESELVREERLLEILPYVPRPFIIYVPTNYYANNILKKIKGRGYNYVEIFTGKTKNEDREKILKQWDKDEIDIIIATTAFGMGVDKKDIRAVIHLYVPESIDGFYQEVGRGGRDGFKSISLSLTSTKKDNEIINYLTRSKVLSVDKIVSRWIDIKENFIERISGNRFWVNTDVTPEYLKEEEAITGELSATWNEYVLLFLYRQKLIDILEIKQDPKTNRHILCIEVLSDLLDDYCQLKNELEPIREKERECVNRDISKINFLLKEKSRCWANHFIKEYYYAEKSCAGCPACRRNNIPEYSGSAEIEIVNGENNLKKSLVKYYDSVIDIKEYMYGYKETRLINYISKDNLKKIIDEYTDCVILPEFSSEEWSDVVKMLPYMKKYYTVFSYIDFLDTDNELNILGNIIIMYDNDEQINNDVYIRAEKLKRKGRINRVIYVANIGTYIPYENKILSECIDGFIKMV